MDKYLIIADDFTGSNDTGVQMKKRGIHTEVVLFPESLRLVRGSMVLDTESRNMPKQDSYNKVYKMVQTVFEKAQFDIV
ncbi:MAG: four-carbon acid sugar kinase family protein, partial [Christensenellaceae bacterium]|nr:four-carbon acid sugar kinase family protein [Christensenellaceae bacterium]